MKNPSTCLKDSQTATEHAKMLQLIEEAIELKSSHPNLAIQKAEQASEIALKLGEYSYFAKSQNTIGVDYGIGIAPHYHKKVFKIFNKLNKHASDRAGIGLAICERIVQLYKGEISVESIPNQFSAFYIKIAA